VFVLSFFSLFFSLQIFRALCVLRIEEEAFVFSVGWFLFLCLILLFYFRASCVLRIAEEEAFVFSTRERAPFMMCVEVPNLLLM
jgi:hypothetical protein